MAQFFGKYPRNVDEKGRVIIPASFRKKLGAEFYIVQGKKKKLMIYTTEDWEEYFTQYANDNEEDDNAMLKESLIADSVMEVKCDSQGRICIPPDYRAHADIKEETTVLGVGKRIDVWNPDKYDAFLKGK